MQARHFYCLCTFVAIHNSTKYYGNMKIPDETHYEEGEKHIEDIPGFVLCTQCDKCPMVSENTIRSDGKWYCYWHQEWREGNDLLEYRCKGFQMKSCKTCTRRKFCMDAFSTTYCNRYVHRGMKNRGRSYVGRRYAIRSLDPKILENESEYTKRKYEELNEL